MFTKNITLLLLILTTLKVYGQPADTTKEERFSFHDQTTVITQFKPAFGAKYSAENSLLPTAETQTSLTSTFYAGLRLWEGASVFLNPEISGGSGLSSVLGVADAFNGETFRVGSTEPKIYLARLFYRQLFALDKTTSWQTSDFNQLAGNVPGEYFAITIGQLSITDYFDDNAYSHDPRTQFLCWGLMSYGAWDYPANTRGYSPSAVLEYVTPSNELRYAISLMPLEANGNDMNWNINKSSSHSLEYARHYSFKGKDGTIRLLSFFTTSQMGNYNQSIALNPDAPDIKATRKYGHTKYGFGINAEQAITKDAGIFLRASRNDGNNETWAFTEIDHSISAGFSSTGQRWNRKGDILGFALIASGISKPHRNYLKAGGKGFMLGDGNLNYSMEQLMEMYYSIGLVSKQIYLTGAYQFLLNPGYNKDRGPVNVFSVRLHVSI
ncbi:MAG: carbohydrate porin [Candidatus Saccharibacteria bacterium]